MTCIRWEASAFALAAGLVGIATPVSQAAAQQTIVVSTGNTDTTAKTVGGTDSVTVQAGGTLSTTTNPAINWSTSSTDLRITNSGIIRTTANGGRAIGTSGGSNARTVTLTNNTGAVIESQDDAFRINVVPTSGTIVVDNFGIIRTTNGGQALDFDGVSGGATIVINNNAGAELRSFGQDAIRPGQGAVVTNAGLIFSDGPANNSYDGVDWQARSGTVINQATGTISGLRHGITSDVNVNVTNAGIILGRNGSGIGSDGAGTVVNTGTITGQWDGVAINGDGDGVDIDFIGSVTNSGIIQGLSATGVDSGGRPNSAEGIAMGGGTIVNNAGALVFGAGNAILINHDTNPGGVADGATTITNAGTIRATTGRAVSLVGVFNDTLTNSGTITGGTAGAIDLGDGNDTLNLLTGSIITGTVDGGAGTDVINLGGSGSGSFAGAVNFESLAVNTGNWTVSGPNAYANGIAIAGGASLTGTASVLSGNTIANAGSLTFDQPTSATFTGSITGAGSVTKAGAGTLTLGTQTYTGATNVNAGTLALTGTLAGGSYTVASGATLTSALATTLTTTATTVAVTNAGTISSTNASGRAISLAGAANARTITFTNNAGGLITSADDAVRINFNPTGGSITVNNAGTIQTTASGQALDFDAAASGSATIIINNTATGVLRSFGQDAIRPGQGAVVTNAGLIFSDGPANNSYDGIDWQGKSGVVNNLATGTISGLRHGITSDVNVNVTNAGIILGRNGSGIGSDGAGTVVNTGTITGQWDGVAINGDGDGVDIDFIGSVTNSGIIQGLSATGVDSGGRPNSAEGIAMGGGTIVNNAGALVFGAGNAILINHDTNPGGVADGATTITNAGTIRATTGRAVSLVGVFNDTLTNSGTITGGTAGAIDLGDGNDTLNLLTGSVITGTVDGGAGTDVVNLGGSGSGSFAGAVNFESLAVNTGNWTLTAASSFTDGITVAAPTTLTGNSATLVGPIADAGTVVFNQTNDGSFAGSLTGTGTLVKTGAGALTIGNQAFTGATSVTGGRLVLAGTLPSAVTVTTGGTLAGNGTVASLAVASGGTVAPGNSVGTITVTGAFTQAAGSTYQAETTAAGTADRIVVGGAATIGSGAQLAVSRDGGSYTIGTRYTLLTAGGGITGSFTLVQTASGGTEFRLGQNANALFVDVARTAASLPGLATTQNQAAVAPALGALGTANAAYSALTLIPDDTPVRAGLDLLSGEVHASVRTAMLMDARAVQQVAATRLAAQVTGNSLWVQAIRRGGGDEGVNGAADSDRSGWGGTGGIDVALGASARAGVAGGYTRTTLDIAARSSSAELETIHALAYAGGTFGPLALRGGVGYAWVKNDVRRSVAFTGFSDALASRYDGNVLHGFVEAGIVVPVLAGTIEPFAGVTAYRVHSDAFAERGGAAALTGNARNETFTLSKAGVRAATPIVAGVRANAVVAWQHVIGDYRPEATLRFTGGTVPFDIAGTALSRDAATMALDVAWTPKSNVTVSVGYAGTIGERGDDSTLRAGIAIGF